MGSGPECPSGCSSRLGVVFRWVGGVCMKPSGGKTALHTNHYCSSVAATQPLIYSTAWLGWDVDTHMLAETYLIIHQDCREEIIEKHCCLWARSGSIPRAEYAQFITTSKSVLDKVFTTDISVQFSFGGRLSGEPQHDRKVLLQRYTGPYLIPFQWIIYDHYTT